MERKLSDYIDTLNQEKKPREHGSSESIEYEDLMDTVRTVRQLKEYEEPSADFEEKLLKNIKNYKESNGRKNGIMRRVLSYGAVAAVFVMILIALNMKEDIVEAMEASYKELKAYHGVINIVSVNGKSEETVQANREVWADETGKYIIQELEGSFAGESTVNNGEKKWKINTKEKTVEVYSAFPDTTRFTFDIGDEIKDTKNALKVEEVGEESIHGMDTLKLAVTPQGGEVYHLWIDKATNLPVQRQTPMHNGIQYRLTYVELESLESIPEKLLAYEIPEGYAEIDKSFEQIVANEQEAEKILGFKPITVEGVPDGITLKNMTADANNRIFRIYYRVAGTEKKKDNNLMLLKKKTSFTFETNATSILGTVNGHKAEYIPSVRNDGDFISYATTYGDTSERGLVRWQEDGYEYAFVGDMELDSLIQLGSELIGKEVTFVIKDREGHEFQPDIKVEVDLVVEENTQKGVDRGSSPWKLDPAYVASVEASILMSPDGIVGDASVAYEDVEVIYNDGINAIAEINLKDSMTKKIYMEKLIRRDETGIWTMVGYDIIN